MMDSKKLRQDDAWSWMLSSRAMKDCVVTTDGPLLSLEDT